MRIKRYTFVFVALYVLFLSLTAAKAQGYASYHFLEVLDADRRPVADAKIETNVIQQFGAHQTDENGAIKKFPLSSGDFNTLDVKVSKSGYFTYEETGFFTFYHRSGILLKGEFPKYDRDAPIKIELLKMPTTSAERKTFEVRRQEQELLKALKRGDTATVRSLLQTGVSANTTDIYGIPAILLAMVIGDAETIKALLAAGADLRSENKPGRKALLYYLYLTDRVAIKEELAQSLIEAGADVNAKLYDGVTALTLAKQIGDEKIIKLLKSAASKPK